MNLYQLIYISTATSKINEDTIRDIGIKASEKNKTEQVTGLLAYKGDNFIQVLEGKKKDVLNIYQNIIVKDKRNTRHLIVYEGEISKKEFGEWGMATFNAGSYKKVAIDNDQSDESFRLQVQIEGSSFVSRLLRTYLRSF